MKAIYLLLATLLFTCCINAQTWQWTHPEPNGIYQDGNSNIDYESDLVHNIQKDSLGNIYVLGDYYDSLYLNNVLRTTNSKGSFVAKYDSTGKLIWYQLIKPQLFDPAVSISATDICVNSSGVFVTGLFSAGSPGGNQGIQQVCNYQFTTDTMYNSNSQEGELFLAKLSFTTGNVLWLKQSHAIDPHNGFGDPAAIFHNPVLTSDKMNNLILGFDVEVFDGNTLYTIDGNTITVGISGFEGQAVNVVLAKFNTLGSLLWSNFAANDNTSTTQINSIASDNNSNIFIYGNSQYGTQFGSVVYTPTNPSLDFSSSFLAKISSGGTWSFAKELDNNGDLLGNYLNGENPYTIVIDNSNNIYTLLNASKVDTLFGSTIANPPVSYLAKFDNSGNLLWYKNFGNKYIGSNQSSRSIYISNNSLYLTGALEYLGGNNDFSDGLFSKLYIPTSTQTSGTQYYVAKTDTSGNFIWVNTFADNGDNSFGQVGFTVCANGTNVYSGGFYSDAITTLGHLGGNFSSALDILNPFFGKLTDQYIHVGAVSPIILCPGYNINIPFTSYGLKFSSKNTFTAQLSDSTGDFTTSVAIGSAKSTGTGKITATIPANLPYSKVYHIRIVSSDTLKTGFPYYAYADTTYVVTLLCPAPTNELSSNITSTSAKLKWNTVACGVGYKVEHRVMGTTAWNTRNIMSNTDSLALTGLTGTTTYQWRAATTCNNGTVNYSTFSAIKTFTTTSGLMDDAFSETSENGISIYPNPARTSITVSFNSEDSYTSLQVVNATGQSMMQKQVATFSGKNMTQVNVSKLASGIYMLLIKTKGGILTKQFVKE